jgi:hypothetical protein
VEGEGGQGIGAASPEIIGKGLGNFEGITQEILWQTWGKDNQDLSTASQEIARYCTGNFEGITQEILC